MNPYLWISVMIIVTASYNHWARATAPESLKEKRGKCTLQRQVLCEDGVPHIQVKPKPLEG